jgi:glutamate-ammonia-ligase adenylyltransferase
MRSTRARELLTELMPILLQALADTPDPDAALLAFDRFLTGLPAGIQLFSMFHSHPQLLRLVAEVIGRAPRLAEHLARRPAVLESVLSEDFFDPPPPLQRLERELGEMLSRCRDLEEVLDASRRWAGDRRFQIGVQSLRGMLDNTATARGFSDIAESALRALYARVQEAFAQRHGRIAGSDMAIIAMGKLGGREMTAASDLDLIFVYTSPAEGAVSEGPRRLPASQYFARLSQRLINALTAPTAEGVLNEVDMRLRPSGKAGPLAVSFESFRRYQSTDAWTWERMALTRARVIAGPRELLRDIEAVIREVLTRRTDPEALVVDIADMRRRMEAEHEEQSVWEVKHLRGGIVDIEFIAQYLQLRYAWSHPQVLSPNTSIALQAIRGAGLLVEEQATVLLDALRFWDQVQTRLRLTWKGSLSGGADEDSERALAAALRGLTENGLDELAARIQATAESVRRIYDALIDHPAGALTGAEPPARGSG